MEGFWRVDTYEVLGAGFLVNNVAFGLALIPLAVWMSRKFGALGEGSSAMRWLTRELGGYNLNAAQAKEFAQSALD